MAFYYPEAGDSEMMNALTIDLEPWYVAQLLSKHIDRDEAAHDDQIAQSVGPVLELLDKHDIRATFFVLGKVAEKHPEIVAEIHTKGHEIGSHCYSHHTLHELGEVGFRQEIESSVKVLHSITGERPAGFRAPSFSMNYSTRWALSILREFGFTYDSSVFPVKTMLYGIPGAPLAPYRPSASDPSVHDPAGELVEFPLTAVRIIRNVPVAGGFYLRFWPLWFLRMAILRVNRTRPAIIYFHPWETFDDTPRLRGISHSSRFITYYGIRSAMKKLDALLQAFQFGPLMDLVSGV